MGVLRSYAERIDHWEEMVQGSYRMSGSQRLILYDDGAPLKTPPTPPQKNIVAYRQVVETDTAEYRFRKSTMHAWHIVLSTGDT